jgi:formyltetrahydrofolate-dependent phosphoribosylglycinamide formyltransferase
MSVQGDAKVKPIRLGVLISGSGRTLMNIHRLISAGELPARITVVIASRPCKGQELAQQAGLKVELVPYRKTPDLHRYSDRITAVLDAAGVDLVVLAGFLSMWHIPPHYQGRVINIHPALLPGFGGKGMYGHFVHEAVLAAGCKVSGCSVHFVTNEYDRGPIILQRAVQVLEGDTPQTLADRVFQEELLAMPQAIRLFAEGRLHIEGDVVRVR